MKPTKHNLKKLEELLAEAGYEVRYEKGNFQSGYCVLESKRVAVVNKFFAIDGRFSVLSDIIASIDLEKEGLSEAAAKTLKQLKSSHAKNGKNEQT